MIRTASRVVRLQSIPRVSLQIKPRSITCLTASTKESDGPRSSRRRSNVVVREASTDTTATFDRRRPNDGVNLGSSSSLPASTDLLELYRGLVAQGKLKWDDEQVRCVMKLRHLLETLEDYEPPFDLLARLSPSAPKQARKSKAPGWWKGREGSQGLYLGEGERETQLVKVLSGEEELANLTTPKGILITGPPGTGKSLLLSLFFQLLPTAKKQRHHYHAFTLSLYQQVFAEMERRRKLAPEMERLKAERMDVAAKKGWKAVFAGGRWEGEGVDGGDKGRVWEDTKEDIPFVIARKMIMDYHILYFDELQLVDASSASLLRDVLSWYWRLGGVIVSCSNRVPDDLYHHGVQKDRMAGFLEALKARCEVIELDGGRDWRRGTHAEGEVVESRSSWLGIGDDGFESAWETLAGGDAKPSAVNIYGRRVKVPLAGGGACRFTFADLCEEPLGPADYISVASTFRTFFIDDVPILYLRHKNEARRLINLVDALYEARCQLFIRAESPPTEMFFPDALLPPSLPSTDSTIAPSQSTARENNAHLFDDTTNDALMAAEALSETLNTPAMPNISVYNPTSRSAREEEERKNMKAGGSFSVLSIFTGEDERFAYKRAVSRLVEMTTSPTYAHEQWIPIAKEGRGWESFTTSPISPTSSTSSKVDGSETKIPLTVFNEKLPPNYHPHPPQQTSSSTSSTTSTFQSPTTTTSSSIEADSINPQRDISESESESAFAEEASYPRPRLLATPTEEQRKGPPVIGEHHAWGVGEGWGGKAGKWGLGPKVFAESSGKRRDGGEEGK